MLEIPAETELFVTLKYGHPRPIPEYIDALPPEVVESLFDFADISVGDKFYTILSKREVIAYYSHTKFIQACIHRALIEYHIKENKQETP